MTRYKYVKNLIENDKEGFIGWVAAKNGLSGCWRRILG